MAEFPAIASGQETPMSDQTPYTPSEARVCIDFCNAAMKRRQPDGSFMDMEDADEAFSRFIAQVRAEAWFAGYDKGNLDGYFGSNKERQNSPYAEFDPYREEQ